MILNDGTSLIGLWLYREGQVYEAGDIIYGQTSTQKNVLAVVKEQFETSELSSFDDDLIHCGFYNESAVELLTKAGLLAELKDLIQFYKVGGDLNKIVGDVFSVTTPGLYIISSATENLPPEYGEVIDIDSTVFQGYLRISLVETNILYEILDFNHSMYFIASKNAESGEVLNWREITGNGIGIASRNLSALAEAYNSLISSLTTIKSSINSRLEYQLYRDELINNSISIFTDNSLAYLVNLRVNETLNDVTFTRKYSIRVETSDAVGTVYDEFGTTRSEDKKLTLGTGVRATSIYKIL